MRRFSRTVWILSWISLFNDAASEMLYPVMPVYLKSIGFSVLLIGVLEGIAEASAGLSKGYFGQLSDNTGKRTPFVKLGYSLSAISKPMLAIFAYPLWVFLARTMDRFGKGIRTSTRDAMLSSEASKQNKGKIFGLHRAMDTFGAVIGPLFALIYLHFYPAQYKMLFFISFFPSLIAVSTSFLLKDGRQYPISKAKKINFFGFLHYWKTSKIEYRKLIIGLIIFALFNSSDMFLLLKAKQAGFSDTLIIGVYIFYNLIYALASFPMGILADTVGLHKIFIGGLSLFALVYFVMAFNANQYLFAGIFFLYGLYSAATEGISKAWISNICHSQDVATAIGTYTAFQSISTLIASSMAGLLWYKYGSPAIFLTTGSVTVAVMIYFIGFVKSPVITNK